MDTIHEDCFVVFVRADRSHDEWPENVERPVAVCSTYEEARQTQRALHTVSAQEYVIRFVGPTGGGD
jgi:hypothetical protein